MEECSKRPFATSGSRAGNLTAFLTTVAGALLVLAAIAGAMSALSSRKAGDPRDSGAAGTVEASTRSAGAGATAPTPPAVLAFAPPPGTGQRFALVPSAPFSDVCGALESRLAAQTGSELVFARLRSEDCMFELELARHGTDSGRAGSLFLHLRGDEADVLRHLRIKVNVAAADARGQVFAAFGSVADEVAALAGFAVDDDLAARLAARQRFENETETAEVSFLPERFGGERYNFIVKFTALTAILPADGFNEVKLGGLGP